MGAWRGREDRREGEVRGGCKQGVRRQGIPHERSNEVNSHVLQPPHLLTLPLPPHTSHLLTPHTSLTKDVEKRPHYSELLTHPLILEYETKPVDIGLWYQEVCKTHP